MKKILILLLCLALLGSLLGCRPTESPTAAATEGQPIAGGWSTGKPTVPTEDQKALLERAVFNLNGVIYTPVLYLGYQVVGGMNHRFLCRAQATYPDAPVTWVVLELYDDLTGNPEVTNVTEISEAEAERYEAAAK